MAMRISGTNSTQIERDLRQVFCARADIERLAGTIRLAQKASRIVHAVNGVTKVRNSKGFDRRRAIRPCRRTAVKAS